MERYKDGRRKMTIADKEKSSKTYISFYLSDSTIRIFKTTVRALGTPPFLQFLVHPNGQSMVMQPCGTRSFTTIRVSSNIYSDNGKTQVYSKGLCRLLANKLNWDINCSYRTPGRLIPHQKIVVFDLSQATVTSQSSSYKPILHLRNE